VPESDLAREPTQAVVSDAPEKAASSDGASTGDETPRKAAKRSSLKDAFAGLRRTSSPADSRSADSKAASGTQVQSEVAEPVPQKGRKSGFMGAAKAAFKPRTKPDKKGKAKPAKAAKPGRA